MITNLLLSFQFLLNLFILFFDCTTWHVGSWFLDQGSNPRPLYWKLGVLTIGQPGKSLLFLTITSSRIETVSLF